MPASLFPTSHANQRVPIYLREWPIQRMYRAVRRRQWMPLLICGLVAFFASAGLAMFRRPFPAVHDEFSYLLLADTLLEGRLANPPHPLWEHFETFHVIQQPTYASKFSLGQGVVLAFGQLLIGEPLFGVWISLALASAATYWMLHAWVPPRWALIGGLIAALRFVCAGDDFMTTYWSQSLWGGAVPTIGGALLLGAARRIADRPTLKMGLVLGAGLAILLHSQPREALLLGVPTVIGLAFWLGTRKDASVGRIANQTLLPATLVIIPAILLVGYVNWRITGDPWKSAEQIYDETYNLLPEVFWERPLPADARAFRHGAMRNFQELLRGSAEKRTAPEVVKALFARLVQSLLFFLGTALAACLVLTPLLRRRIWDFVAAALVAAFVLIEAQFTWFFPHSIAAVSGLIVVLGIDCLRCLRTWRWNNRPLGRMSSAVVLSVTLVITAFPAIETKIAKRRYVGFEPHRAQILSKLEKSDKRHLVIVRYLPGYIPHDEWIANRADIDGAKVVWARDMGPQKNRKLIEYFGDREIWLLPVTETLPELRAYAE